LEVKVTTRDKWRRSIDVHLSSSEVELHIEKLLRSYQKRVALQGFRKGKTPLAVIRQLYGDAIKEEAVGEVLPQILYDTVKKEGLKVATPAKVDKYDFDPDGSLRVHAELDIEPEVELKTYTDFALEKKNYEIGEPEVDEEMQRLLEQRTVYKDTDAPGAFGDRVLADIQEVDAVGLPVIGNKMADRLFVLAEKDDDGDNFFSQIVGARRGEIRNVKVWQNNQQPSTTSSLINYQVSLKKVQQRMAPVLDDTFAQSLGSYKNLDEMRQDLRRLLEAEANAYALRDLKNQLVDMLIKSNPIDLPESIVDFHLDLLVKNLKNNKEEIDEKTFREEYRADTIHGIKWRLVKQQLIARENLELEADDAEQHVRNVAIARRKDPQRAWNQIKSKPDDLHDLTNDLLENKLLTHLLGRQRISEKKVTRQDSKSSKLIV